jgi:hypothetical protein
MISDLLSRVLSDLEAASPAAGLARFPWCLVLSK